MAYNKALNQRNTLLRYFAGNRRCRGPRAVGCPACPLAVAIRAKRAEFVERFVPGFLETYREITNGAETVSVRYLTEVATTEEEVHQQWNEAQNDDRRLRRTTRGIHKDDLAFDLGEHPIKKFGSQGQQKSFLIALRLRSGVHRTGDGRQAHSVTGRHFR